MSAGWVPKRFWTKATAEPCDGGYVVRLDARPAMTPGKSPLILPTLAMADAIAAEWAAQGEKIDPAAMPFTRAANSAIDKVTPQFAEVVALLAAYGGTDLLCYRGAEPSLRRRQDAAWDPLLDWSARTHGAPLTVTTGVIPVDQPRDSLDRLATRLAAMMPFQIVAAHDLVAITGSLVLGLAVMDRFVTAEDAWTAARIDETWQSEIWGVDEEAALAEARRHADFLQAERFFRLCG
ncbi:MAG: ATP12 family protein [Pseudomonadota bacterium]